MLLAAQIRQAVAERLAAASVGGGNVFQGQSWPVDASQCPCWVVSLGDTETDLQGMDWPAVEQHEIELEARGYAAPGAGLEQQLDALELAGRTALFATRPPFYLRCTAVRRDPSREDGAIGAISLQLRATAVALQDDPETLIA